MDKRAATAEVAYIRDQDQIEITVPQGLDFTDASKLGERLLSPEILNKLGHGHEGCLSGSSIIVRERFSPIVSVEIPQEIARSIS